MIRLLALLALVGVFGLGLAGGAAAVTSACLPFPYPSTPTPPVFSTNVTATQLGHYHIDVWRVPCQDGSGEIVLLLRVTPITQAPFICSLDFKLIQNSAQIETRLRQSPSLPDFCGDLLIATTFSLERGFSQPPFDTKGAFTLDITQGATHITLEVPAGGGASPLSITVISAGCNPCHAGQVAEIRLHFFNPASPLLTELKAGARLPDGTSVTIGRYTELTLPSGDTELVLLPPLTVPQTAPPGGYVFEAAILEPDFGVTLSRHSVTLQVL